jgi:ribosomal-protein-alanine N-acetyltransferase
MDVCATPQLRPNQVTNMTDYYLLFANSMAGQWLEKKEAHTWIKNALEAADNYNFVIELLPQSASASASVSEPEPPEPPTNEQVMIGSIGLHRGTEVGYMFHPDYWGKGYATEALSAFVSKVWEMLPQVEKLGALTDNENEGSMAVLRKCGFVEVRKGEYVNATMGERTEVEFEAVRPKLQA